MVRYPGLPAEGRGAARGGAVVDGFGCVFELLEQLE